MIEAFWDTSSLVPLCVTQKASGIANQIAYKYSVVTWWGTSVEVQSAMTRLLRMSELAPLDYESGQSLLQRLEAQWFEIEPGVPLRAEARRLLTLYPLKAADALQLAAALSWAGGEPAGRQFICGDRQLIAAARHVGFDVVET